MCCRCPSVCVIMCGEGMKVLCLSVFQGRIVRHFAAQKQIFDMLLLDRRHFLYDFFDPGGGATLSLYRGPEETLIRTLLTPQVSRNS